MDYFKALVTDAPFIITLFWAVTVSVSMVKHRDWYKVPLFVFLSFSMIALLAGSAFLRGNFDLFRWLYFPASFMAFSMFPTYYLYITSLTSEKPLPLRKWVKHLFIPFIHAAFAGIVFLVIMDKSDRVFWIEQCLTEEVQAEGIYRIAFLMDGYFRKLFLVLAIAYYALTDRKIFNHRTRLSNYFSNTEQADIRWFPVIRVSFFFTLLAAFFHFTSSRLATLENEILPIISFSLLAIFFWVTGYFSQSQRIIYPPENADNSSQAADPASLSKEQYTLLANQLEKIMEEQKVFTQRDLTLPGLSRMLGTNRTYLSKLFNEHLHISFSHYINQKRVDYIAQLLDESKKDKDIRDLWVMCGFNSASSFYRWFHIFKGTSPMAYRERIGKK